MAKYIVFLLVCIQISVYGQNQESLEKPPVFESCSGQPFQNLKQCFKIALNKHVFENFEVPKIVEENSYRGSVKVLFEVDKEGNFLILYIDAIYDQLKTETNRVFESLPQIKPGTYNGNPTFYQYSVVINIPLTNFLDFESNISKSADSIPLKVNRFYDLNQASLNEFDAVNDSLVPFQNKEYSSQLNIPFTHSYYARFDAQMNAIGTNSHTASKPFLYADVQPYYNIEAKKNALAKDKSTWLGRKFWNEHLVQVQGEDYWFIVDPIFDLQVGKDTEADFNSTYNNTRGVLIQGGLGKKFNFYTTVFESQGRFAQYFNEYSESLKAFGPDPAIIPGRGIGKRFKSDSYDYPVAEAYLSYSPTDFLNVQFGYGKNFIGDGYRSILLSDVSSPHPFLKINTKFWKIKYTNTWMWLNDVRPEVVEDGAFLNKYMANHYLSWNVSKRLNIGLFESVIWDNSNGRGFDINYLNPIIFYRAIEFATGQAAGNAIIGLSSKYKWNNSFNIYGQFILDEFSLDDVTAGNKSWKNKFGYQLGVKYFNAFEVDNLLLQFEYNQVRPYTYSHNTIVLNYAHNNQPMAHLWGANFREAIVIGRYNYERWFADAKIIIGERGFDFNTADDSFNYGGNIFRTENDRVGNTNIRVAQGNTTAVFHAELQTGYILNPASNLRLFTNISYRNFDPQMATSTTIKSNTLWFSLGVRTDLFNWHIDF
ncbi:gliding motility protein RemB [Paucihalobacter sp.]|uniref:gliding motility protein RemB n=1 Tax=Paucihalobacter sp. TaxID=2850405 RepID=UPI002FE045C5